MGISEKMLTEGWGMLWPFQCGVPMKLHLNCVLSVKDEQKPPSHSQEWKRQRSKVTSCSSAMIHAMNLQRRVHTDSFIPEP